MTLDDRASIVARVSVMPGMVIEHRDGRIDAATDLGVRAAKLSELALSGLDKGRWPAVIDDASPTERVAGTMHSKRSTQPTSSRSLGRRRAASSLRST